MVGIAPRALPRGFELRLDEHIVQMVRDAPLGGGDIAGIVPLGERDREDMRALTALVYPHYFRERTAELGRYFGIRHAGRLAAMIGERMGAEGARELSAICTHPDFTGRGLARALTAMLTDDLLARGMQPFLHVSPGNARARALYERMGYRRRRDIPLWSLRRAD